MKKPLIIYVSPLGNMQWSGRFAKPLEDGSDGPTPYPHAAILKARRIRRTGSFLGPIEIRIQEGDYFFYEPLHLHAEDSDLSLVAEPGQRVCFHGAIRIENWKETSLNGKTLWSADLPPDLQKTGCIRSLFVNGKRRARPISQKEGWTHFESVPGLDPTLSIDKNLTLLFQGSDRMILPSGVIPENEENVEDAEILVSHFWVTERLPIKSWNPKTRELQTSAESLICLKNDHTVGYSKFRIENLKSSLKNQGEWYVDRKQLKIYYIPLTEEKINQVKIEIPFLSQLIRVIGTAENPVKRISFEGIDFFGTESILPQNFQTWSDPYAIDQSPRIRDAARFNTEYHNNIYQKGRSYGVSPQAAYELPGVLHFRHASYCRFEKCIFHGLGVYAIVFEEGSTRCEVLKSEFYDLGAGAIQMDGGFIERGETYLNGYHHIIENHIYDTGHIYPAGVGILSMISIRNRIESNHIHHTTYSGISCGWMWGVDRVVAYGNQIIRNHIHHIGDRAGLNDMAAIYALGVQPGTQIDENWVHDASCSTYGGGGIYLDQGAALMSVQRNLISGSMDYGIIQNITCGNQFRENIVAVNCKKASIFFFGANFEEALIDYPPMKSIFEKNIIRVSAGKYIYHDQQLRFRQNKVECSMNRYFFDCGEQAIICREEAAAHLFYASSIPPIRERNLEAMKKDGFESYSEESYEDHQTLDLTQSESLREWVKSLKVGQGGWSLLIGS